MLPCNIIEMSPQHALANWSQYLQQEDYEYLIQFVENVKERLPNNKMIVLAGPGRTGKSTLKNEIKAYLGNDLCETWSVRAPEEALYSEHIKVLGFFNGIDEIYRSKKSNQAIINFIQYNQSFIADTIHPEKLHHLLSGYTRIIHMTHIF
jgi:tRNA A37 threonylcarbamoyladenosine biosynthesis protein TsaE